MPIQVSGMSPRRRRRSASSSVSRVRRRRRASRMAPRPIAQKAAQTPRQRGTVSGLMRALSGRIMGQRLAVIADQLGLGEIIGQGGMVLRRGHELEQVLRFFDKGRFKVVD